MRRICFAPEGHPNGSHNDFQSSPFGQNSSIWIGYRDDPTKAYRDFSSFEDVIEMVQTNSTKGHKDRFPRVTYRIGRRSEGFVPPDDELDYNTQCSACSDDPSCDCVLMQYVPIKVWDYKRWKDTHVFLCSCIFTIQGETMIAFLKHSGQGFYGFQRTDGSTSRRMAINCVTSQTSTPQATPESSERDVSTDSDQNENAISVNTDNHSKGFHSDQINLDVTDANETELNMEATVQSDSFHKHNAIGLPRVSDRNLVIDLTMDETNDMTLCKQEPDVQVKRDGSYVEGDVTQPDEPREKQPGLPNPRPSNTMNDFGAMLANVVDEFGIEALSLPEVKALRTDMAQAATSGNREMLCQIFGTLNALLLSYQ